MFGIGGRPIPNGSFGAAQRNDGQMSSLAQSGWQPFYVKVERWSPKGGKSGPRRERLRDQELPVEDEIASNFMRAERCYILRNRI